MRLIHTSLQRGRRTAACAETVFNGFPSSRLNGYTKTPTHITSLKRGENENELGIEEQLLIKDVSASEDSRRIEYSFECSHLSKVLVPVKVAQILAL